MICGRVIPNAGYFHVVKILEAECSLDLEH